MPQQPPQERLVYIASREGRLPYSKGVMTQTLTAAGLSPERGHVIASLVERRLTDGGTTSEELTVAELYEFVERVLRETDGDDVAHRFRRWTVLRRKDIPILLLLGGTAGSGKSTVAQLVAARLGITRVTSTDAVRQVMRACFNTQLMPVLHHSSFEVPVVSGVALPADGEGMDLGLLGYLEQARQVCVGTNAIVERAERERVSTIIEGVHLLPGLVSAVDVSRSAVINAVCFIDDEDTHRSHFTMRALQTDGSRPVDHYLRNFARIRQIQEYLVDQAHLRGVPTFENTFLDDTVRRLVDHTLDVVERVARERDAAAAAVASETGGEAVPVGIEVRPEQARAELNMQLDSSSLPAHER